MTQDRINDFPWELIHNTISSDHFLEDGAFGIEQLYDRRLRRNVLNRNSDDAIYQEAQSSSCDTKESEPHNYFEVCADEEDNLHVWLAYKHFPGNYRPFFSSMEDLQWSMERAGTQHLIIKPFRLLFLLPDHEHVAWTSGSSNYMHSLGGQFPFIHYFLTVRPGGVVDMDWHPYMFRVKDQA